MAGTGQCSGETQASTLAPMQVHETTHEEELDYIDEYDFDDKPIVSARGGGKKNSTKTSAKKNKSRIFSQKHVRRKIFQ